MSQMWLCASPQGCHCFAYGGSTAHFTSATSANKFEKEWHLQTITRPLNLYSEFHSRLPSTCNTFTVIALSLLALSNLLGLSPIHNKAATIVSIQISRQKVGSPTHNGVALWIFLFIISFLTSVRKSCIRSVLQPSCWVQSCSVNASIPSNKFIIIYLPKDFILRSCGHAFVGTR